MRFFLSGKKNTPRGYMTQEENATILRAILGGECGMAFGAAGV